MQFMSNETVIFKDGKDINWEVTYLGSILSDGILKHKTCTQNNTQRILGRQHSSLFYQALDIVTIPLTAEQYQIDLPKLTDFKLMWISTPQTLDSDHQEFMDLQYKLSNLPLPAMIVLAEKGKIKKKG